MKIRVHIPQQKIDETVEVRDAGELLRRFKSEAARRAPFLLRPMINGMSDQAFAGEVVKRANAANGRSDAPPQNAQEFLDWAIERGHATRLD